MSIKSTAQAAARAAFAAAKAGEVLVVIRLKLLPTVGEYDPATDTTPTAWGFDKADVDALEFDDVEGQRNAEPEERMHSFLVLGDSMVADDTTRLRGEQEGEIVTADGLTWHVKAVETDPTGTVWIFNCRR